MRKDSVMMKVVYQCSYYRQWCQIPWIELLRLIYLPKKPKSQHLPLNLYLCNCICSKKAITII